MGARVEQLSVDASPLAPARRLLYVCLVACDRVPIATDGSMRRSASETVLGEYKSLSGVKNFSDAVRPIIVVVVVVVTRGCLRLFFVHCDWRRMRVRLLGTAG